MKLKTIWTRKKVLTSLLLFLGVLSDDGDELSNRRAGDRRRGEILVLFFPHARHLAIS